MTTTKKEPRSRLLTSVLRALALLDVLADVETSVGASDLAGRVDADRSSVFQQLQTLVHAGWVEQLPDATYRLTLKAFTVANGAMTQAGLGARLTPWLDRLATRAGETASLVMIDGTQAIVVARREPSVAMKANIDIGTSLSMRTSASARILLAVAEPGVVEDLRHAGVETPSDRELAQYRTQGWSEQCDELYPGMHSVAIALRTTQGADAALSLAGPTGRIDRHAVLDHLRAAAAEAPDGMVPPLPRDT
ncbi:IclR family transcriptional regulator [Euzebya tangerina]|uniref:IclR family transcriptional regulator n=1 Tax=Euzebya tangerina TaxID=591198 RepID=UPI000E31E69B|nr:IclR family transcriptional regulator [Euzebya tangerina]